MSESERFRVYQRGITMLMVSAVHEVLGGRRIAVEYSINNRYICELRDHNISCEDLGQIEATMHKYVESNMPITLVRVTLKEAIQIAKHQGQTDKLRLLHYRNGSHVSLYKLGEYYDYLFGELPEKTGVLSNFSLHKLDDKSFILMFEKQGENQAPAALGKISEVFSESSRWARILGVDTVGALNDKLCTLGLDSIIRTAEALHEKKVANIADKIAENEKRIVLIAGPSSSGKTTFANRLRIQLKAGGLQPHLISLDDYYKNRDELTPEPDGSINLERPDTIDVALVNKHLESLLNGEEVEIPHFNFLTAKREYKGRVLRISGNDVIIMEGIHGLNERISANINPKDKFKIFISALTQLSIDNHNRIPTSDTRLLRRLVRDFKHRGASAERTLGMWGSVLAGESEYIFPFQDEADSFFNSALIYELCVLKQYAMPLLYAIEESSPHYTEARRLLRFLDTFLGQPSEQVPPNSILREFIGGGWYW